METALTICALYVLKLVPQCFLLYFYQWDTSRVTNMHTIFAQTEQFDQDLSRWDISQVRDLR